ncbi:transcription termination/antitermination protein NusG [Spiroplasma endosymbiont of Anurida maritima]|uniref:transcription termination/antitermination protein NusG n=1 Tax=Spiroplasma endosymbiont of Anurida maritima TaxID=2967972 RepID=UPI0036D42117
MNTINNELNITPNNKKGKWYVINSYSGQEDRVLEDLKQRVESLNLTDKVFDIRVVKEKIVVKKGQKPREKNVYPGYIFINMKMHDDAWYVVRNTTGVTGFIGSSGKGTKPFPLTDKEVERMLGKALNINKNTEKKEKKVYVAHFKVGDVVTLIDGPLAGKDGKVVSIDTTKGLATVNVEMFGRLTPAEVEFSACQSH